MNMNIPRGYFTLLVLVFSAVFFTLISALAGFIFVEKRVNLAEENRQKALHIAEAGLEYYKWHLAHYPNDLMDGTGQPGPYVHAYSDPESGTIGTFSLEIDGAEFCGSVSSLTITSTGWTAADPSYKRVLVATYARPSVADYSTIVDANVWAGGDRIIQGPYHSNGGIRMDATHNAPVSSGVGTWTCTSQFGCSGSQTQNGVFGAGSNPSLWDYPVPPVDFGGISVDLLRLKGYATSSGGVYLGSSGSGNYGWHVTFNSNGTLSARQVTGTTQVWGYTTEGGWAQERPVIATQGTATQYTIPAACPVVFVEDNVWVDGTVSGQVVLAAADVSAASVDRSVIVNGNLTYANASGDGITVLGEQDVLVGLETPDVMTMRGIFIAQKGRFGRNHYCVDNCSGSSTSGDTGYRTAGATPSTTGWSNFTTARLASNDGSRASCSATCDDNDNGQLGDFSFTIPGGASISGIEVIADMNEGNGSGTITVQASLSWNGGASFTTTRSATVNGTGDANYTFGGSADTWGRAWSDTEFANGAFRLRLDKGADNDTLSVDQVRVRVYYVTGYGLPGTLDQYVTRSTLNTYGTVVSKGRVGTKWTSGSPPAFVSGYAQRNDSFDRALSESPPPFTPATSDDFIFKSWSEAQ